MPAVAAGAMKRKPTPPPAVRPPPRAKAAEDERDRARQFAPVGPLDVLDFVPAVVNQVPDACELLVRYYVFC